MERRAQMDSVLDCSCKNRKTISKLLIDVFNDVSRLEEEALKGGAFSDMSVTETHTIDAIGMYAKPTMTEVAKRLNVTMATLSVAIAKLVKKGYALRIRSAEDRRVVHLGLTNKGRLLFRIHDKFHKDLAAHMVGNLSVQEESALIGALSGLHDYLTDNPRTDL